MKKSLIFLFFLSFFIITIPTQACVIIVNQATGKIRAKIVHKTKKEEKPYSKIKSVYGGIRQEAIEKKNEYKLDIEPDEIAVLENFEYGFWTLEICKVRSKNIQKGMRGFQYYPIDFNVLTMEAWGAVFHVKDGRFYGLEIQKRGLDSSIPGKSSSYATLSKDYEKIKKNLSFLSLLDTKYSQNNVCYTEKDEKKINQILSFKKRLKNDFDTFNTYVFPKFMRFEKQLQDTHTKIMNAKSTRFLGSSKKSKKESDLHDLMHN